MQLKSQVQEKLLTGGGEGSSDYPLVSMGREIQSILSKIAVIVYYRLQNSVSKQINSWFCI